MFSCAKITECLKNAASNIIKPGTNNAEQKEAASTKEDNEINSIYAALDKQLESCLIQQAAWQKARAGFYKRHPEAAKLPEEYKNLLSEQFADIFKTLFEGLKERILPVEHEVRDIINESNRLLVVKFKEIDEMRKQVRDKKLSSEERTVVKANIYNEMIAILEIQIEMLRNVKDQIQLSIENQSMSESLGSALINCVTLVVTKVTVPSVNVTFSDNYSDYVFEEVKDEVDALELYKFAVEKEQAAVRELLSDEASSPPVSSADAKISLAIPATQFSPKKVTFQVEEENKDNLDNQSSMRKTA